MLRTNDREMISMLITIIICSTSIFISTWLFDKEWAEKNNDNYLFDNQYSYSKLEDSFKNGDNEY